MSQISPPSPKSRKYPLFGDGIGLGDDDNCEDDEDNTDDSRDDGDDDLEVNAEGLVRNCMMFWSLLPYRSPREQQLLLSERKHWSRWLWVVRDASVVLGFHLQPVWKVRLI